ncbi:MAG TPA: PTS sugar transporter subunit IIA [Candidatus Sulfotelmatobacter sp.]|nr:PTS sugar transporter subunit IIA [Candidatus Sulfotelmatobacter sp.]
MSILLLPPLLDTSLCISDLKSRTREAALAELVHALNGGAVRDGGLLRESLARRERLATTAIGKGLAFPNVRSLSVGESRLVLARSSRGVAWDAGDRQPVHLLCAVLSPAEWTEEMHHESLTRAVNALKLQRSRQRLLDAEGERALRDLWRELLA